MPDFPFEVDDRAIERQLRERFDVDGKIPRALADLGDLAGRRVLLSDVEADGERAAQVRALGATVVAEGGGPPERQLSFWGALHPDAPDAEEQLADVRSHLAPEGRLLLVHDYGRDDAIRLLGGKERQGRLIAWSDRKGWFLARGFKVRVLHCWWTFESLEEAAELLGAGFGEAGAALAAELRRPRVAYKVAIYHLRLG